MKESDVHKCLFNYGFFPMTIILKKLEEKERYQECNLILKSMISFRERFKDVWGEASTKWSKDFENKYYSYFDGINTASVKVAKNQIKLNLKDIKQRLKL